jgi:hypothetical protein
MSSGGFIGYKGGVDALLADHGSNKKAFQRMAMKKYNVLHVGGSNTFQQYKYTKFMHPLVQRAVDGGATQLVYLVTEGSQRVCQKIGNAALVGDYSDVCEYVAMLALTKQQHGVYFYQFNPAGVGVPQQAKAFLDFDFVSHQDEPWQVSLTKVLDAVDIVNAGFETNCDIQRPGEDIEFDGGVSICYGSRDIGDYHWKHSYHVTWHKHGFQTQADQGAFMRSQLNKREYDNKVYTNGRLMRSPWFGKAGDTSAILYPTTFTEGDDGEWTKESIGEFDAEIFKSFNITPYAWDKDIIFHTFRAQGVNKPAAIGHKAAILSSDPDPRFDFMEPLLNALILPRIQEHRRRKLGNIQRTGVGSLAGVPVSQYKTTQWERSPKFDGQYSIIVTGDTFCEHDTDGKTPYYHEKQKTKIVVDLQHGYYMQMCYTCKHAVTKYGIFAVNNVEISGYFGSMVPRVLDIIGQKGGPLFLRYYAADMLFNPLHNNQEFVVYDEKTKLWCAENSAYMVVARTHEFAQAYRRYRVCVFDANFTFRLAQCDGDEKKIIKLKAERVALQMIDVVNTNTDMLIKGLKTAYKNVFGKFSPMKLNTCEQLVPMCDGTCYDVVDDVIVPRTKEMMFTSMLSDTIKDNALDDECKVIKSWFLEISRGREALSTYLKCIFGLVMTSLDIDRAFYVLCGILGRNGKTVAFELLEVRHICDIFATHLRHTCDIYATYLATYMRHICDTFATYPRS